MSTLGSKAVETARTYYNSSDADSFYFSVWGGEDIHIGLYQSEDDSIAEASRRTVERMAGSLTRLDTSARVLDIGAGYGGAARWLAKTYGCHVTALNLSEVENTRNREMSAQQGLADKIEVIDGAFEQIDAPDDSFDVVWSQDAILHSGDRDRVLDEVARVLKPGGEFVFTDPMQADDCPEGVLQPILDRIHLETLGSPGYYRSATGKRGFVEVSWEDLSHQLPNHYGRVLSETQRHEDRLRNEVSEEYLTRMKKGLQHWVDGGRQGHLAWGIFVFRKQ